jgi:hypothetical protein
MFGGAGHLDNGDAVGQALEDGSERFKEQPVVLQACGFHPRLRFGKERLNKERDAHGLAFGFLLSYGLLRWFQGLRLGHIASHEAMLCLDGGFLVLFAPHLEVDLFAVVADLPRLLALTIPRTNGTTHRRKSLAMPFRALHGGEKKKALLSQGFSEVAATGFEPVTSRL